MTREVFKPLGMERTVLEEADEVPGTTSFYFPEVVHAHRPGRAGRAGDGLLLFCGRWRVSLDAVGPRAVRVFHGEARLAEGRDHRSPPDAAPARVSGTSTEYALGWKVHSVQLAGAPVTMLGHRGSPVGGTVSLMMFPDLGLVIAAASNVTHARGVAPLGLKVAEAFATPADEVAVTQPLAHRDDPR